MTIQFKVPGPPTSKGRPKFSRRGNFVKAYTPQQTVNYENLVKLAFCEVWEEQQLKGAIRAEMDFYFPIPKSASKKKHKEMADGIIRPVTVAKDVDNCVKAVLDALNKIAYDDDRQVVEVVARKWYADIPHSDITLEEIDGIS